ncbi:MAG: hypothetical protein ABW252_04020 [Polyangiales bacterium]
MELAQAPAVSRPKWLALGAVAVLLGLVIRSAWVTEDAYITLRTIDNWVAGLGLRWNVDERVQGYTHPLWMFLLSVPYFFTREAYLTSLLTGILTTLAAALLTIRNARSAGHATAAIGLLLLSRSFVEFSTSGLENPLTHLLIAQFVWVYAVRREPPRTVLLVAGLLALNRTDALLVTVPALVHLLVLSLRERGWRPTVKDALVGFSPVIAWVAFSLFYYGFAVPNTAFAKLNTGLPKAEVARQGLTYVLEAAAWDPPLLVALGLGCALAFGHRRPREVLLAVGVLVYLGYVVKIGGDFMLGRFLTLPLFLAASLVAISELPLEEPSRLGLVALPFVALFLHPSAVERYPVGDFHFSGIADERSYYREGAALMYFTRKHGLPSHHWATAGRAAAASRDKVLVHENIGFFGYYAGPKIHIIDLNALSEPMLARLPSRYDPEWRVGHYLRELPAGYLDTIKTGKCMMPDASLCEYHAKLREIISGDLWSLSRLGTIVKMNLGGYQYLVDWQRYRYPKVGRAQLSELEAAVAENAPWDAPGVRTMEADGVEIDLGAVSHAKLVKLSLDGNDNYELEFRLGTETVGSAPSAAPGIGLMHGRAVPVPEEASKRGYDHLWVRPTEGDGKYSVGYLRLR